MDLLHIIIYLVIVGVILGLINRIPMASSINRSSTSSSS